MLELFKNFFLWCAVSWCDSSRGWAERGEARTGTSATRATTMFWKAGGGRWDEGAVCLSRGTDKVGAGGFIEERILSCVRIVSGTDHAMRQTVYIL